MKNIIYVSLVLVKYINNIFLLLICIKNKPVRLKYLSVILLLLPLYTLSQEPYIKLEVTNVEDIQGVFGENKIAYEKISGKFHAELDPNDMHNTIITDINLAERNSRGYIQYTTDFFLIKPKDMKYSNGVLRYYAPNRGNTFSRPDAESMGKGDVFISAAWQGDVDKIDNPSRPKLYLDLPIAKNGDDSTIKGKILVEFTTRANQCEMPICNSFNNGHIAYTPAAFPDNTDYIFTKRLNENDPRRLINNKDWAFATTGTNNPFPGTPDSTKLSIRGGFEPDYLYELIYEGKNPKVMGIGLVVVRDILSFFKNNQNDSEGTDNPVAGKINKIIGYGVSQSGNFMKTFINLGFNEDLNGDKVFDGLFLTVGARQNNINMRFAVPGGGAGVIYAHKAFGQASVRAFDPDYYDDISGKNGGIFTRSATSKTIPRVFMVFTSSEFWVLQASMALTDAYGGKDIFQPENLRIYFIAGTDHMIGTDRGISWNPKVSLYPQSIVDGRGVVRALRVAFDEWVLKGIEPPESQVPTIKDKTLAFPEDLKFPAIKGAKVKIDGKETPVPDFEYKKIINNLPLLDWGPGFYEHDESGIATVFPPAYLGRDYAVMVSRVDEDGNEVTGIKTPEMAVPLGTNLGFNYDARDYIKALYGLEGAFIPFHKTKKERLKAGDSRLSLEERYSSRQNYVRLVEEAANKLVRQRFLLPSDAEKVIQKAKDSSAFY